MKVLLAATPILCTIAFWATIAQASSVTLSSVVTIKKGGYSNQVVLPIPQCSSAQGFLFESVQIAPTVGTAYTGSTLPDWGVSIPLKAGYVGRNSVGDSSAEFNLFGRGVQSLTGTLPSGQRTADVLVANTGEFGMPVRVVMLVNTPVTRSFSFSIHVTGSCNGAALQE